MNRADVIRQIGEDRYAAASAAMREHALSPGYRSGEAAQLPEWIDMLPHEIADDIWEAALSSAEKIQLFFSLYDDLPGYGMLMYASHHYDEWSAEDRVAWWSGVRERIVLPHGAPLQTMLVCDFFVGVDSVEDSWNALTHDRALELLARVLPVSGPVPWALKGDLLSFAAGTPELQQPVFEALLGATFGCFGSLETEPARALLDRLTVDPNDPRLPHLVARLAEAPERSD